MKINVAIKNLHKQEFEVDNIQRYKYVISDNLDREESRYYFENDNELINFVEERKQDWGIK